MTFDRSIRLIGAAALIATTAGLSCASAWAQPEGLPSAVRYRAAQEGAAVIKLQAPAAAAQPDGQAAQREVAGQVAAERKGPAFNVVAERKGPAFNVEAERKGPAFNVEAERKGPAFNVEAERKGPAFNVEAEVRAHLLNVAAEVRSHF